MKTGLLPLATAAALLACAGAVSCSSERAGGDGPPTIDVEADAATVASADADFGFALYERLAASEGNLFFSPRSIHTALSMTLMGARGETESQMMTALGLSPIGASGPVPARRALIARAFGALSGAESRDASSGSHVFAEANALWCQEGYPFLDEFLFLNREGFGAGAFLLDFGRTEEARGTINKWVEEKTLGKIRDLIGPADLDALVRIVLTNAVYFKGKWDARFDPAATHDAVFRTSPGDPSRDVTVPTMTRSGEYLYAHLDGAGLTVVQLPYEGGAASMLVVLPDEDLEGGLSSVEARLSAGELDDWLREMQKTEVLVSIPKFEMTWGSEDIIPELRSMGIVDLFSGDADLSGMDGTKELYVSRVLHKAFVEVNEEGTEAAAATAVIGRLKAVMPIRFTADRPFLFLIRDTETGDVLFMGRLVDPTA